MGQQCGNWHGQPTGTGADGWTVPVWAGDGWMVPLCVGDVWAPRGAGRTPEGGARLAHGGAGSA